MGELEETRERNQQTSRAVQLDFTATGRRSKKLLTTQHLSKTLGGRRLFTDLQLSLTAGMRLGLLGRQRQRQNDAATRAHRRVAARQRHRVEGGRPARSLFSTEPRDAGQVALAARVPSPPTATT